MKKSDFLDSAKELIIQILWEVAGSVFIAAGIYNFAVQAEFPLTGFSGISMIVGCITTPS